MAEHYDEPPGGWELFDKPRAKPVSKDKGEAISLELVENLKYGGMHIRKWENLSNLGAGTHKLYTHPADQVADDLTMVKASRELLQDLRDLAFDQVEHHRAAMGAYKQARQSAMDSVLAQADALLRS